VIAAKDNRSGCPARSSDLLTTQRGQPYARVVFLAQNRHGWGNLCECITLARRRAAKGSYSALVTDVEGKNIQAPQLAGMPGCLALLLPEPDATVESVFAQAMWMRSWFPQRAWLVAPRPLGQADELRLWIVEQVAAQTGLRIVASSSPVMHTRKRKPVQDVLTAVRIGTTVMEAGFALQANAEAYLRGRAVLARQVPPEWMAETVRIASLCTFSIEELKYEYPREVVPEGETPSSHLRKLTYEGAAVRYPAGLPAKVRDQIGHELAIIARLEYEAYFLTVADVVHSARSRNILCQGRGPPRQNSCRPDRA
jgi:error-prone DNA polymerase